MSNQKPTNEEWLAAALKSAQTSLTGLIEVHKTNLGEKLDASLQQGIESLEKTRDEKLAAAKARFEQDIAQNDADRKKPLARHFLLDRVEKSIREGFNLEVVAIEAIIEKSIAAMTDVATA